MPSELHTVAAPPSWRIVDFISDVHLQVDEPKTFLGWQAYILKTRADAIFILGDLFEVWVGDDAQNDSRTEVGAFEAQAIAVLLEASQRKSLYFMHGNRDFLIGKKFAAATNIELLPDPCLLEVKGTRWVLSHGDQMCLADVDYQQFRKTVRTQAWISSFLGKPLSERRSIARVLRQQSQAHQDAAANYADVDAQAAAQLLASVNADHLIHGHTHRPADHLLDGTSIRHVLSDWDLSAAPARAQVFRLTLDAHSVVDISRIDPSEA